VPYFLVTLSAGKSLNHEALHALDHRDFIGSLIARNLVLLGGALGEVLDGIHAAYVLRCGGIEEARRIAAEDPLVLHGVMRPVCVEWELVGVNPAAIEPTALIRPTEE
jgi:uncharacterized protein YciI